jgi:hypothetical protein
VSVKAAKFAKAEAKPFIAPALVMLVLAGQKARKRRLGAK